MAGNWTDRDREDLEFGWGAHRRDESRRDREERNWRRDARYASSGNWTGRGDEERSWTREQDRMGRNPGADRDRFGGSAGPAVGYQGSRPEGWTPRFGSQDYTRGGRSYGEQNRAPGYMGEYGEDPAYSPARDRYHAGGYGQPGFEDTYDSGRFSTGPGRYDYERRYGDAGRGRTERTQRFEDAGRNAGDFFHRAGEKVASWFGGGSDGYERQERNYRGRGPKGYNRSDERIREDINERLTDDRWLDASEITVAVMAGEVTLTGAVEDREAKHRAERIVEEVTGVKHVQNNLRVGEGSFFTTHRAEDSAMRTDDAVSTGTGGSGAGQSTAGRKN